MAGTSEPFVPQNYSIPVYGSTLGFNTVSSAGAQVIGFDPQRKKILFGNPNATVTIYVYQLVTQTGANQTPSVASPGGAWPVLAGAVQSFEGDVQGPWGAFASSGSTNAISIMGSRS